MVVIADTSPLNYLVLIEYIDILPSLYGSLVIPPAVQRELLAFEAPSSVRQWADDFPAWLEVRDPGRTTLSFHPRLNAGEREAITLAHSHQNTLLLMDEALGRHEAHLLGLSVTGTLGVLRLAHLRGLLDLGEALTRLRVTNFQASASLLKSVLDSVS